MKKHFKFLFCLILAFGCCHSSLKADHLLGGELSYKTIDYAQGVFEVTLMLERPCNANGALNKEYPISVLEFVGNSSSGGYIKTVYVAKLQDSNYIYFPCSNSGNNCSNSSPQLIERKYYRVNIIVQNTNKECVVYLKENLRTTSTNIQNADVPMVLFTSFIPKYYNHQFSFLESKRHFPLKNQWTKLNYTREDEENDSLKIQSSAPFIDLSYNFSGSNLIYSLDKADFTTGNYDAKPFSINESQLSIASDYIGFTPSSIQSSWLTLIKSEFRKVNLGMKDTWIRVSKSNSDRLITVHEINSSFQLQSISSSNANVKINSQSITVCNNDDTSFISFRFPIEKNLNLSKVQISLAQQDINSLFTIVRLYGTAMDTIQMMMKYRSNSFNDLYSKMIFDIDLCHPSSGLGFDKRYEIPFTVFNYKLFDRDIILSCSNSLTIPVLLSKGLSTNYGLYQSSPSSIWVATPLDTMIVATLTQSNSYCPFRDSIYINHGSVFSVTTTGYSPSCKGYLDASAKVVVTGTNSPYSFRWSNFSTNDSIGSIPAGLHIVEVKDKDNCTQYDSIMISEALGIEDRWIMDTPITCYGGNDGRGHIQILSPIKPNLYVWDYSLSSDSFKGGLSKGVYTGKYFYNNNVGKNCIQNFSFSISQPDSIYLDIVKYDNVCFGDSIGKIAVMPRGGHEGYVFFFDNVQTSSGLKVGLPSANYAVYVKDNKNCTTSTYNVTIQNPPKISYSLILKNPSCIEVANGSIAFNHTLGGVSPYNYSLNNAPYNGTVFYNNLSVNNYLLKIKDANGCVVSQSVRLSPLYSLNAQLDSLINSKCPLSSSGKIYWTMNNGVSPYKVFDNLDSQYFYISKISLENVSKGSHTIKIVDQNQCVWNQSYSIQEPDSIRIQIVKKDETCYKMEDGSIQIQSVVGGTIPYMPYRWYNDKNELIVSTNNLVPGQYTLKFEDKNNCKYSYNYNINSKPIFKTSIDILKPISCNGYSDGIIRANLLGGISPYRYIWNQNLGLNTSELSNISAGQYKLEIKDADDCVAKDSISLSEPTAIKLEELKVKHNDCPNSNNGAITISCSGGASTNSKFQYKLDGMGDYSDKNTFLNIPKGLYTIKIKDENSCEKNWSTEVKVDKSLTLQLPSSINLNLGETIELSPDINYGDNTSASDIKTAFWSPNRGISCLDCIKTLYTPIIGGIYSLDVTYGNNCVANTTTLINISKPDDVYIPNSFSPNNDTKNDIWYVYGKNVKWIDIQVINRVGELVFQSNDMSKGWDGTYKSKLENIGTYKYIVKVIYLDNSSKDYEGMINLLR